MKVAIVYTSITGNTEEAMNIIWKYMSSYTSKCYVYEVEHFPFYELETYDAIIIGTYTWGNGDVPHEMIPLYRSFENSTSKDMVTGVFGTGDQCYPHFCGAVDEFRDMLYVHSNLAATLKIELMPQHIDEHRFERFVEVVMERVKSKKGITV
ncbi:flavodoxin domain-containing protein [Fredinandcohnia sp. QZ13]|uniref:flavodoxin domain-containing protein n=1 Tax=Fredinandcohnia sp. QZ13 TaxID=3073144 RepID=UPI0028534FCA|nr:flavodoxin domain-containing protein [Fredinandcohnia sp. QZ13]MDR4887108.1 flavodoxin domain-containing protein [Fredinandcohnia sp. QZ13]